MNRKVKISYWGLLLFLLSIGLQGQTLSLDSCLQWARQNYPSIKQLDLIAQSENYSVSNVRKAYLPQFQLAGQATYQSDVTSLPIQIPNMNIPELSKDQYRVYGEINQSLTALFTTSGKEDLTRAQMAVQDKQVQVELYKIRERVIQLYFGIMLLEIQEDQLQLTRADLEARQKEMQAALDNGIITSVDLAQIKAEMLKLDQKQIDLRSMDKAYRAMFSQMIGRSAQNAQFDKPNNREQEVEINRPELQLFSQQQRAIDLQRDLVDQQKLPQISLFFQGGYGRPALNMLNNDFDLYYIGGLRLQWNFSSFYTAGNQKKILKLEHSKVSAQQESFVYQTQLQLAQELADLERLDSVMSKDLSLLELQEEILESSAVQLKEGTLQTSEYLRRLNNVSRTRQDLELHRLQRLMAEYQYANTQGN